jgi:tetratricopeptide (TPR) repeat protein
MAKSATHRRFDRRSALDKAQILMHQGKVPQAIEAYTEIVRHDPADWSSANTLGDLFVRAGLTQQAIDEYARIADDLANAGFFARAGAIYKKVLRLDPKHVDALRQTESLQGQRFAQTGGPSRQSPAQAPSEPASQTATASAAEAVPLAFEATSLTDAIPDTSPA